MPDLIERLNGTRTVPAILRAVVRGEHFDFRDRIRIGINVQRLIAAVIHVVAAVQFPVIVLGAAAVDAHGDVPVNAHRAFILAGLIAYAGRQASPTGRSCGR